MRALFVDLDGAPIPDLDPLGLLAHILVETSPGRFHLYWLVEGLETTEFTALQDRLAALFRGDPTVMTCPALCACRVSRTKKSRRSAHGSILGNTSLAPYEADAFRARLSEAERNCFPQPDSKLFAPSGRTDLPPDMNQRFSRRSTAHRELLKRAGWCSAPVGK